MSDGVTGMLHLRQLWAASGWHRSIEK